MDIVELFDNGVNADTTANDGVYTRYYTNVTQNGRYSVKCQVINDGGAYQQLGFIGSPTPIALDESKRNSPIGMSVMPLGSFSRISSAGSFQVLNPRLLIYLKRKPVTIIVGSIGDTSSVSWRRLSSE